MSDPINSRPPGLSGLQFRLVHILYATALIATSVSVFGRFGIVFGTFMVGYWATAFRLDPRQRRATIYVMGFPYAFTLFFCLVAIIADSLSFNLDQTNLLNDIGPISTASFSLLALVPIGISIRTARAKVDVTGN